ncbi:NAD(P)H-hydrate epimerase [Ornithinimicrobium sp. W1665]|uniref:NAD(P)H-hydrate epimerase n=1 Tax=Ornithinimicrobium sp. W1665 TaxID=3416666 RepID=UPI003D6ABCA8
MIQGYDVATVRAVEDRVRAGLPDGALMQRAARGLAQVVRDRVEELGARSVVVLAGPGDNGGDALWAASFLASDGRRGDDDGRPDGDERRRGGDDRRGGGDDRRGGGDDRRGGRDDRRGGRDDRRGDGDERRRADERRRDGAGAQVSVVGIAARLREDGLAAAREAGCPVLLVDPAAEVLDPARWSSGSGRPTSSWTDCWGSAGGRACAERWHGWPPCSRTATTDPSCWPWTCPAAPTPRVRI